MQGSPNSSLAAEINASKGKWAVRFERAIEKIKNIKLSSVAKYILLFDLAFVFMYPFLYIVITSLKTNADLNDVTVNWVPRTLKWENYVIAFRALSYNKYLMNSLLVTVVGTIGHILSCSFIGYGFARYRFPGKNIFFFMVLLAIIVPVQTLIVPLYMIYTNLDWLNSYLPILVPTFFGFGLRGGLFIFIFRQFYLGLPSALEDAAKIDGCGFLRTYWNIVLPVVKSAFLVTMVLSVVWHWNDYYEPSIYAAKSALALLPAKLSSLVDLVRMPPEELFDNLVVEEGENSINNAVVMAGTFLVVFPVLAVYGFLQRKFMQGVERTGIVE